MLKQIFNVLQKLSSHNNFLMKMAEKLAPVSLGKRPAKGEGGDESQKKKKKKKQHVVQLGPSEGCKRKIALLMAYNGAGYYGVQINPGYPTIESEIFPALVKAEAIPQDHADTPSKMWFQRGSRTDKGVSAVGQVFSLKILLVPDLISKLNEHLPPQIRALGYVRTTNGYDSKNWCDGRTYMYMTPTFAFAPIEKFITDEYRTSSDILERVREILRKFLGTHKFHNFTSGVKFEQACAARYIISFDCSEPYVRDGIEFVTLRVKGQSFMLHHIRKMIGLTIAIVRGYCGESTIESCWGPDKVDVPKAPGLGLVLETLHFTGYNRKFGSDGVHEPIEWSKCEETIEKFKEEYIISYIIAQEKTERVMFNWLRTLQFHNFDQPRLEGPQKPWVKVEKLLAGKLEAQSESQGKVGSTDTDQTTAGDQVAIADADANLERSEHVPVLNSHTHSSTATPTSCNEKNGQHSDLVPGILQLSEKELVRATNDVQSSSSLDSGVNSHEKDNANNESGLAR